MALLVEQVDGVGFATEASMVLREGWANQSVIDYTPEYIAWQLSFPGPLLPVAYAAFDGREPIGFAAATGRQFRMGPDVTYGYCVSFWCMRPGKGTAATPIVLLSRLARHIRQFDAPAIAFGVHEGVGEKVFPEIYKHAGFHEVALGWLPGFTYFAKSAPPSDWIVNKAESTAMLLDLVPQCATTNPQVLYICPDAEELRHYLLDPRPRQLLAATDTKTGARAAAWLIRMDMRNADRVSSAPTLESVFLDRSRSDALPALLWAAAHLDASIAASSVVNAPSLGGFDADALRRVGIRKTGGGFEPRLYLPPSWMEWKSAEATAAEII